MTVTILIIILFLGLYYWGIESFESFVGRQRATRRILFDVNTDRPDRSKSSSATLGAGAHSGVMSAGGSTDSGGGD